MSLKRSGKIFLESENDHIFFSRLKCHCYPKPHQGGCCAIRGYQRFASPTELSCVERIIICLTDPTALLQQTQIFLSQTSDSRRCKALKRWRGANTRCSFSPTFKSVTPLIFSLWVEDPEEEEESQDAGWPGHWCRDNVSLWEMERHQFSPDWLHHRQNILNFVIFRITPCQCQQSHHPQHHHLDQMLLFLPPSSTSFNNHVFVVRLTSVFTKNHCF